MRTKFLSIRIFLIFIVLIFIWNFIQSVFNNSSSDQREKEKLCIEEHLKAQFSYHENIFRTKFINVSLSESIEPICQNGTKLVIVTHSSPKDFLKRQTIRLTWGQWTWSSRFYQVFNNKQFSKRTELFFIIGNNNKLQRSDWLQLLKESASFRDIIYYPHLFDNYYNLTNKTIAMLNWVTKSCPAAEFIMKTDSDIFLNIPLLVKSINNQDLVGLSFLAGTKLLDPSVNRDIENKWYVSKEEYKYEVFPPYVEGPGYILSRLAVLHLNRKLKNLKRKRNLFKKFEDVFLGFMIENSEISLLNWNHFMLQINYPDLCIGYTYIVLHKITPYDLISNWCSFVSMNMTCPYLSNEQISFLFDTSALHKFDFAFNNDFIV